MVIPCTLDWEGTVRVCGGLLSDMLYDACGRSYSNFNEDAHPCK